MPTITNGSGRPGRRGMRRVAVRLAALAALATMPAVAGRAAAPAEPPVVVMVLGTFHMANPGLDVHNVRADDVTSERRQRELEAVAAALAKFRPTKIAVEFVSDAPDRTVPAYEQFTPADLATSRDERVQIAFRLARQLGHARVHGIDEHSETVDYFPLDRLLAFAQRNDREAELAGPLETGRRYVARLESQLRSGTIGDVLVGMNEPRDVDEQHAAGYFSVLPVGAGREQPGAELNAMWFLRNAKIFAKLAEVAVPGDRVLVVFGGGHSYWLRHLARTTPGFELAEPNDYLAAR